MSSLQPDYVHNEYHSHEDAFGECKDLPLRAFIGLRRAWPRGLRKKVAFAALQPWNVILATLRLNFLVLVLI